MIIEKYLKTSLFVCSLTMVIVCIKLATNISLTMKLFCIVLLTIEIVLFFRTGDAPTFDNEWKQKTGAHRRAGHSVEDSGPTMLAVTDGRE